MSKKSDKNICQSDRLIQYKTQNHTLLSPTSTFSEALACLWRDSPGSPLTSYLGIELGQDLLPY